MSQDIELNPHDATFPCQTAAIRFKKDFDSQPLRNLCYRLAACADILIGFDGWVAPLQSGTLCVKDYESDMLQDLP